ncbi:MAG: hypothetical protein E6I99_09500 [Chloroflexi bacterium]|nr:MAG: hypothetical protein E6I99_09500 [Chloroflexota bacterium]TMD84698.1 MAG: hypothetical protein E6I74_02140 [Chloroflexota bacterium]
MGKLPGDACPFPRPFPEGFSECAVFEEVALRHRRSIATPEMKVVSCRNLTVGTFWDGGNHHYGKCRLGDSAARLELAKNQIVERHTYINSYADSERDDPGLTPIIPR